MRARVSSPPTELWSGASQLWMWLNIWAGDTGGLHFSSLWDMDGLQLYIENTPSLEPDCSFLHPAVKIDCFVAWTQLWFYTIPVQFQKQKLFMLLVLLQLLIFMVFCCCTVRPKWVFVQLPKLQQVTPEVCDGWCLVSGSFLHYTQDWQASLILPCLRRH